MTEHGAAVAVSPPAVSSPASFPPVIPAQKSDHALGSLTYLINLFRDKLNQMQSIYLSKHEFAS